MGNNMDRLRRSAESFRERILKLGADAADRWIGRCSDIGELTKAAHGYEVSQEYIDDEWAECQTDAFIEEFGGVPDYDLFIQGFYERLEERKQELLDMIEQLLSV